MLKSVPLETDAFGVFAVEQIVVLNWKQAPQLGGVLASRALFEQQRTRRCRFGYYVVVEAAVGASMSVHVRDALAALLKEYAQEIIASVIVFEGTGFMAAIVRSIVAAIHVAARSPYPLKVTDDLVEGAAWLTSALRLQRATPIEPTPLLAAVRAHRAAPLATVGAGTGV